MIHIRYLLCSFFGVALMFSTTGHTSGFRIPEMSAEGVALTNALVANPERSGAFPYNYATMIFQKDKQFSVEAIGVTAQFEVATKDPNAEVNTIENQSEDEIIPSLYYTHPINSDWSWGAHVGVPFGTGSIWPENTFSYFDTVDTLTGSGGAISGLHPTKSIIEIVNITPSVAYNIGSNVGVAIAVDYYVAKNVELNAVGSSAKGDGDGYGFAASIIGQKDDWTFGFTYHSEADIDIAGDINIVGLGSTSVSTEITLPARLQVGVNRKIKQFSIEFDIERIGWSSYDKLTLTSKGGVIPTGTVISEATENFRDITNYRVGLTYQHNNKMHVLLGGGMEDKAQTDDYFDATVPDNQRFMLSIGLQYILEKDWTITGGYQYAWSKKRNYAGRSYLDQIVNSGGSNVDPNGADVYNGEYNQSIHLLGLGISKKL